LMEGAKRALLDYGNIRNKLAGFQEQFF
jgi:hypothetical protein